MKYAHHAMQHIREMQHVHHATLNRTAQGQKYQAVQNQMAEDQTPENPHLALKG